MSCLRLPRNNQKHIFDNGAELTYEEILLFSLNRFVHPSRLSDLVDVYGKDYTMWSRAFKWFNNYMVNRFGYLLTDYLNNWKSAFPSFADKVRLKLIEKGDKNYSIFGGSSSGRN